MAQFGELLAELRVDHKLTQKELAKIIYVSPGTISNYENGVHYPDVEKLIALADFFQVTTDYLLGRCSANLSPEIFNEAIIGDLTAGRVIHDIKGLPQDRKQALAVILSDMRFRAVVGQYNKKEKP